MKPIAKILTRSLSLTTIAFFLTAVSCQAQVIIDNLDVRVTGIFGHNDNVGDPGSQQSTVIINGNAPGSDALAADPIDIMVTYSGLDLDLDGSANDTVNFTLTAAGGTNAAGDPFQRIFGQGIDTGFGSLNDVTVSVTSVSGTTTDSGDTIVFDGFTGAEVGAGTGAGNALDRSVEVNGTTLTFDPATYPDANAFQFHKLGVDFASPVSSLLFDNSGGSAGPGTAGVGSIVARSYDLQFSATDIVLPTCNFTMGDTTCDIDDLNLLLAEGPIQDGVAVIVGTNDQFDLNTDGTIDSTDRNIWLAEAATENGLGSPYLIGDSNLDGVVDVSDFNNWNSNKFTGTLAWNQGDFDGDGFSDVSDFNLWNANKFNSSDTVAVPEPNGLCIVLLGLPLLTAWRKRAAVYA